MAICLPGTTQKDPNCFWFVSGKVFLVFVLNFFPQRKLWTQLLTVTNYGVAFPTFGDIAGVNAFIEQLISPALEKLPSWWCHLPWQVSICSDSLFICGCLFFLVRHYVFSQLGSADCTFLQWKTGSGWSHSPNAVLSPRCFLDFDFYCYFCLYLYILFNNWEKGSSSHPDSFCSEFSLKSETSEV